jgi:diadenosine tetraphosphate (Ap4A) HIT family hydrolase
MNDPIYADDLICAYHWYSGEGPEYLGTLVVQPRRHAKTFAALTDAEAQAIGLLTARLSRALETGANAERAYVYFFGEVVPHLHLFVVARYPGTPEAYWRMNLNDWPDAPKGGAAEIASLSQRLRAALASDHA